MKGFVLGVQAMCRQLLLWLTLLGLALPQAALAQAASLRDLMDRLEYAYYTTDVRALQRDLASLEGLQDMDALATAHASALKYGRWKLAQLTSVTEPALAEAQALACVEDDRAGAMGVRQESAAQLVQRAINLSLRAACWRVLEQLRPLRSTAYRKQRNSALTQAETINARLPQILLIKAIVDNSRQTTDLQLVVSAFDASTLQGDAGIAADWGHAEACLLLGQTELAGGNVLAARNALERALVLAPDYAAARELLRSVNLR